jgi:hypothetical protein
VDVFGIEIESLPAEQVPRPAAPIRDAEPAAACKRLGRTNRKSKR